MKFIFEYKKAVQLLASFASKNLNDFGRMKAMKLVFFSDKEHLKKYGRPITGDRYVAMKHGPVPSATYNLVKGIGPMEQSDYVDQYIDISSETRLVSKNSPYLGVFSESEIDVIKEVLSKFGHFSGLELREISHKCKEWDLPFNKDENTTWAPMNYEDFFDEDEKVGSAFQNAKLESEISDDIA